MYKLKEKSKWTVDGSVSTALSFLFATGGSGTINLKDPQGRRVDFPYRYIGAGKSAGLDKIPGGKGDKMLKNTGKASFTMPVNMPNGGEIWILESFNGSELKDEDISGACVIVDISFGAVVASGSLSGILLGIPYSKIPQELTLWGLTPTLQPHLIDILAKKYDFLKGAAKAVLWMGGINLGFNMTVGASASVGYIGQARIIDVGEIKLVSPPVDPIPVKHSNTAKDITIVLPGDILFDWDDDVIKPTAHQKLFEIKKTIQSHPNRPIFITGHTDKTEKKPGYNQGLSERRAISLKYWLLGAGVDISKVITRGSGARDPVGNNETEEGREKNRRVVVVIHLD